jgi:hypothetical protein
MSSLKLTNHLLSVETAGAKFGVLRAIFGSDELSEGSINTLQVCVGFSTTTSTLTMVLKLYGIYRSPWVRLVAAILLEKQVPFELVSVDFVNDEHKSPEYLAKHPFGQIPYIVCDSLNFCLPAKSWLIQYILFWGFIRTMTASSSTKVEPYAII